MTTFPHSLAKETRNHLESFKLFQKENIRGPGDSRRSLKKDGQNPLECFKLLQKQSARIPSRSFQIPSRTKHKVQNLFKFFQKHITKGPVEAQDFFKFFQKQNLELRRLFHFLLQKRRRTLSSLPNSFKNKT